MNASRTVLVYAADAPSREALVEVLRDEGYGVLATGDGRDAIELTEDCRVDLAVVEWTSRELDGLEIACRVKETSGFVPVIWLGENDDADDMLGFIRNTDGYLSRPLSLGDFRLQVERLLAAKADFDALASADEPLPARTDSVTGVYNASFLAECLAVEVSRAGERGTPVAVLLLDVDDFRKVNTQVGFAAGDAVLRQVAEWLRTSLRAVDVTCRFGPDEFAVVLPFTDDVGAVIAAERLREEIAVHTFDVPVDDETAAVRLTLSIGVAASSLLGYDAEALLRLADEAVGTAKTRKNRVVLGGH